MSCWYSYLFACKYSVTGHVRDWLFCRETNGPRDNSGRLPEYQTRIRILNYMPLAYVSGYIKIYNCCWETCICDRLIYGRKDVVILNGRWIKWQSDTSSDIILYDDHRIMHESPTATFHDWLTVLQLSGIWVLNLFRWFCDNVEKGWSFGY